MREIKFKFLFGYMIDNPFFIKDGKKYLEKVTLNLEQLMECEYEYSIPSYFTLIAKLQYTGLKDKNGVEIYEGDIIKEPYYVDENNGFLLLEVVFYKGAFMGNVINKKGFGLQNFTMYKEVIGNIYENTELLETT